MKHFFTILILIFIFTVSFAQTPPWTKYADNPVLSGRGGWATHIFMPCILYNAESSRYEMWFAASPGGPDWRPYKIGFATSPDGIDWSLHADPVLEADPSTWDEGTVEGPMVLLEEGQYKMWYTGWSGYPARIGYATSKDGINWTKHDPVTISGHSGNASYCSVLPVEGGGYEMWFDDQDKYIYYATSADGISWEKGNSNQAVLTAGTVGQWDDTNILQPHVLLLKDGYHLWYTGTQDPEVSRKIGYATSKDGINWTKYNNPETDETLYKDSDPVLVPGPDQWDKYVIEAGSVMVEGDTLLHMWYGGTGGIWKIGLASAKIIIDLIDENKSHFVEGYVLQQNYPNPFNPKTNIEYTLSTYSNTPQQVNLSIYNLLGQKVATLVDKKQSAGSYQVQWDASAFSSGVYFYRLQTDKGFIQTRKLILLK